MKALILAAGLGTRLRPLTENLAKPSLPVMGVPSLWYPAWHLKQELGIHEIALNLGHAPNSILKAALDPDLQKYTGVSFHFSDESDRILGSSGVLWKLTPWIGKSTLAVSNGDSICFPSWKKMLKFHKEKKAAITLHIRIFDDVHEPYTNIECGRDGRILNFGKKATSGLMFSGSYLFEPELLQRLPAGVSELRPSLLEPLIQEGRLYAYREDLPWIDTGTLASYAEAQFQIVDLMPQTRTLIHLKMSKFSPNCWIPKNWNPSSITLRGPVILTGDESQWLACSKVFGPHFIGVAPPKTPKVFNTEHALVFEDFEFSLKK